MQTTATPEARFFSRALGGFHGSPPTNGYSQQRGFPSPYRWRVYVNLLGISARAEHTAQHRLKTFSPQFYGFSAGVDTHQTKGARHLGELFASPTLAISAPLRRQRSRGYFPRYVPRPAVHDEVIPRAVLFELVLVEQ